MNWRKVSRFGTAAKRSYVSVPPVNQLRSRQEKTTSNSASKPLVINTEGFLNWTRNDRLNKITNLKIIALVPILMNNIRSVLVSRSGKALDCSKAREYVTSQFRVTLKPSLSFRLPDSYLQEFSKFTCLVAVSVDNKWITSSSKCFKPDMSPMCKRSRIVLVATFAVSYIMQTHWDSSIENKRTC